MTDLENAYAHFRTLTFPAPPERDDLGEIVAAMSAMSDRILTLVGRAGRGERVRPEEVPNVGDLVHRLRDLPGVDEDDTEIFAQTVEYLEALADLQRALLGR